jgi:homoserine kinase
MPARPKKNSSFKPLRISLPATSANLGPAFDAAALAFNLSLDVEARIAPVTSIQAAGRDPEICGQVKDNLILETYREVLASQGKESVPLALRIRNNFSIGKGCGSSAAARLAGIALAVHFGRLDWNDDEIVAEASRREHHPDNAAACWLGGVAVARMSGGGVQAIKVTPKGKWPLLLAVPEEALATEEARKVLPTSYSRADVVTNIQNSMLLLLGLSQGRHDLLAAALEDRIHQPYRAPLCPLLPALQELAGKRGVSGVALSGAGPSVLLFLDPRVPRRETAKRVAAHLESRALQAELIPAEISTHGAARSFRR